jgi:GrpB-like predicted nucleotidyltransferase (UPF0157 family)
VDIYAVEPLLTAVGILFLMGIEKELHDLSPLELGKLFPIILQNHDPKWADCFSDEKTGIMRVFKTDIVSIEHIGSTAIPGIKAKPTIDILVEISEGVPTEEVVARFKSIGYEYIPKPENPPPHMMLVKGYTRQGFKGQAYHVHVRYKGDWDELYFGDYLKRNRQVAREYEELKIKLAEQYKNDRDGYTEAKTEFIWRVNKLARQK